MKNFAAMLLLGLLPLIALAGPEDDREAFFEYFQARFPDVPFAEFANGIVIADDQLGTATADVDHQARLGVVGKGVRNPEVNQARLLSAIDDVDLGSEDALRWSGKILSILGDAQRVGADYADTLRLYAFE